MASHPGRSWFGRKGRWRCLKVDFKGTARGRCDCPASPARVERFSAPAFPSPSSIF